MGKAVDGSGSTDLRRSVAVTECTNSTEYTEHFFQENDKEITFFFEQLNSDYPKGKMFGALFPVRNEFKDPL